MKQHPESAESVSATLVYSVDQCFLSLACVSIASILENRLGPAPSATLLLHDVDARSKDRAKRFLESLELKFNLVDVDGRWCEPWASSRGQSQAKFGILRFEDFLESEPARVLIVDADTRFAGDIAPLIDVDLLDAPLAAVDDSAVISDGRVEELTGKLGLPHGSGYFNAGLMVVDVAKWTRERLGEQAIAIFSEQPEILTFNDQCALNAVVQGQYRRLGFRWNHLVGSTPKHWPVSMYHYAGNLKPWQLFAARNRTALRDLLSMEHFDFYDRKSRELDWPDSPLVPSDALSASKAHLRLSRLFLTGKIGKFHRRQRSQRILEAVEAYPQLLD